MSTIGKIAEIFDGPHATPKKTEIGPYFLSISSLEKGRLDLAKSAHLSETDFEKWTKRVTPQKGDLLFSYETRLGEVAVMPDGIRACLGRRMGLLRPKKEKVIPEYLLYAYLSPAFQQTIISNTIRGATVDRIALNELSDFSIRIPRIEEQQKVANLLKTIDAKIDCNNRINAELEAMAKTLYNYWFVQFDFPNQNGKPYKSSGGKMVYNPTLKREIPVGWKAVQLSDLVDEVRDRVTPECFEENMPYIGLEHIARKSIVLANWSTADQAISNKAAFRSGDILFGKIRPYFHKVGLATMDGITSTDTIVMRPKSAALSGLALETVFADRFVEMASAASTGSKMPRADWKVMKKYGVAIPLQPSPLLAEYQKLFDLAANKIRVHIRQNQHLTQLRDWLLPMLMNGQVTVR
jgi:type I restriction enzyme S subunit